LARGGNTSRIDLPRHGSSTPAIFRLRAARIVGSAQTRRIHATLWHNGTYLARIGRDVTITNSPSTIASSGAPATSPNQGRVATLEPDRSAPDLTVYILESRDGTGAAEVIIASPFLQPSRESYLVPAGLSGWIDAQYGRFVAALASTPTKDRTIPLLRGFGRELYRRSAPPSFKEAFWRLRDLRGAKFQTIQIYSNNPVVPWELMRPS